MSWPCTLILMIIHLQIIQGFLSQPSVIQNSTDMPAEVIDSSNNFTLSAADRLALSGLVCLGMKTREVVATKAVNHARICLFITVSLSGLSDLDSFKACIAKHDLTLDHPELDEFLLVLPIEKCMDMDALLEERERSSGTLNDAVIKSLKKRLICVSYYPESLASQQLATEIYLCQLRDGDYLTEGNMEEIFGYVRDHCPEALNGSESEDDHIRKINLVFSPNECSPKDPFTEAAVIFEDYKWLTYLLISFSGLGITWNILCLIVLMGNVTYSKNPSKVLMIWLLASDCANIICVTAHAIMTNDNKHSVTLDVGLTNDRLTDVASCVLLYFIRSLSTTCVAWLSTLITLMRFFVISSPFRAKACITYKTSHMAAFITVALAFIYTLGFSVGIHEVMERENDLSPDLFRCHFEIIIQPGSKLGPLQYIFMANFSIGYMIPWMILCVVNLLIIIYLARARVRRAALLNVSSVQAINVHQASDIKTTIILLAASIEFMIVTLPSAMLPIILILFSLDNMAIVVLGFLSSGLVILNSASKLFIYLLSGEEFRSDLKKSFSQALSSASRFISHICNSN